MLLPGPAWSSTVLGHPPLPNRLLEGSVQVDSLSLLKRLSYCQKFKDSDVFKLKCLIETYKVGI